MTRIPKPEPLRFSRIPLPHDLEILFTISIAIYFVVALLPIAVDANTTQTVGQISKQVLGTYMVFLAFPAVSTVGWVFITTKKWSIEYEQWMESERIYDEYLEKLRNRLRQRTAVNAYTYSIGKTTTCNFINKVGRA